MRLLRSAAVVMTLASLTACGCDADLGISINPTSRTLQVGESFTPSARFLGCGGTEPLSDEITWTAQDTTIVQVDRNSGRTLALRPGQTAVTPNGRRYGTVASVQVTVLAP